MLVARHIIVCPSPWEWLKIECMLFSVTALGVRLAHSLHISCSKNLQVSDILTIFAPLNSSDMDWYEQLPPLCPPSDAVPCSGTYFRSANIAEVTLRPEDGVMKKTFSDSHYSWWRSVDYDVSQAIIIKL